MFTFFTSVLVNYIIDPSIPFREFLVVSALDYSVNISAKGMITFRPLAWRALVVCLT